MAKRREYWAELKVKVALALTVPPSAKELLLEPPVLAQDIPQLFVR